MASYEALNHPPDELHGDDLWLAVHGNTVLVADGSDPLGSDPSVREALNTDEPEHFLGILDGRPVWTVGLTGEPEAPTGHRFVDLYSLHGLVDESVWFLGGRAVQVVEWGRTHRHCGRCGAPTTKVPGERAMRCGDCGLMAFPRLSPAVIMLVHRGDEMLLAHGRLFPRPMYSALAGFVEPGETIEDAVRREVREEVGVALGELEYFASQPWPFPNSLMLGFLAEYAEGDICIDENEIVDAQWFTSSTIPEVPGTVSIAGKLINEFLTRRG